MADINALAAQYLVVTLLRHIKKKDNQICTTLLEQINAESPYQHSMSADEKAAVARACEILTEVERT